MPPPVAHNLQASCPPDLGFGIYETLDAVVRALQAGHVAFAIGGAVAMYAQGYSRSTSDVDVFVRFNDWNKVMRALERAKLLLFEQAEDMQWHCQMPKYAKTMIVADFLLCAGAPEELAINAPVQCTIGEVTFPAFSLPLIVASKATAIEGTDAWVKGKNDLQALLLRKLVTTKEIRALMADENNDIPFDDEFEQMCKEIGVR